ncbi:hypothetical protein GTP38_24105 [Duganella sp. FT94W]|uniref:Uncharacterized protein n=1 Tax=Duganella lactea TaxID=2692173 RepID=A0ABW9VD63_9BURK|nr:hypothetical protein [Duganella lactea]MYM37415.1 hypothetical protein [Duganella lactea]
MNFLLRTVFSGSGVMLAGALFFCVPQVSAIAQEQLSQKKAGSIMENNSVSVSDKDQQLVLEMEKIFEKYPEKFTPEIQQKFRARQIAVGMDPYLAHLAGGAFSFKVDADPLKWPIHADPQQVMWAQAMHPDNSHIWMTFENNTQFPAEGKTGFVVYVESGKVKTIEKL